ncbi:MAG: dihydroorotase [Tannerella sp.]|jgi:dihydroorotase|nr:dihydroorotase [Tannerella sp.]
MTKTLIKNVRIINEGRSFKGSVLIDGKYIAGVYEGDVRPAAQKCTAGRHACNGEYEMSSSGDEDMAADVKIIDASGKWLLPGVIDEQVHFREPGLTRKGDIMSESRAAVAGGVTTFMDMPNTNPQTTTLEALEWKFRRASEVSVANYSFFFGGTNDNAGLIAKLDRKRVPGIKLFLGSSTGNMLVDKEDSLRRFFGETDLLIAVHAEKEDIIRRNIAYYTAKYGENPDISFHPKIRSEEACYASSSEAVDLAKKLGTRLHIFHLSTAKELSLLDRGCVLSERRITGEACVHHLWFSDDDYKQYGNLIKWNPSVKTAKDREALRNAVNDDTIAVVATDHAPHLPAEKEGGCLTAASGGPLIQHSLLAMLDMAAAGIFTPEKVVEKMSHHPADLYHIDRRGYIREGYYADIVLIDPDKTSTVSKENILYKCMWSPFEGHIFRCSVWKTIVNGMEIFSDGHVLDALPGMEIVYTPQ